MCQFDAHCDHASYVGSSKNAEAGAPGRPVSAEDKAIIRQAAAIAGQSVGSFILSEARKAAVHALETRQRIVLNVEQSRRLVEALLAPPRPPTERMKRALKLYRKTVISDVSV